MPGVGSDGRYVHSSGGPYSFEGFVVDELVPYIDANYRTWREPAARAVGGISRGGVWALEISMRHQDLFGIAGGHSPALALNRPLPQYDPFLLIDEGVEGLRFYLDAGDGDWARAGAIRLRNALEEAGADVTYEVHTGGHVDELWAGGVPDYIAFYSETWPVSYEALPAWRPTETEPLP
jgi:enterochelin esterase-like enzyme